MASLDFVYDVADKLNEDGIDYLIVAVQHSEEESRSDIFYNLKDDRTPVTILETVDRFHNEVLIKYLEDLGDDETSEDDSDDTPA
jgi:hypothetical protein